MEPGLEIPLWEYQARGFIEEEFAEEKYKEEKKERSRLCGIPPEEGDLRSVA